MEGVVKNIESILKRRSREAIYYAVGSITLIVVAFITYRILNKKVDKFQDYEGEPVAAGATVATVKLPKATCIPLKSQIDQYKQVKQEHSDIVIMNLDETIRDLERYFKEYGCDTHTY